MLDISLIVPPQWSPFQPTLGTASLKSYLQEQKFGVQQHDWNIEFYHFFIGPDRVPIAIQRLKKYLNLLADDDPYRGKCLYAMAILDMHKILYEEIQKLRDSRTIERISDYENAIMALYKLLMAFSTSEPVVTVGISNLNAKGVRTDFSSLNSFSVNEATNPFLVFFKQKIEELVPSRVWGISVIGNEQIIPALTLCRLLKTHFPSTPIIIGGSVFSRLVEKNTEVKELFGEYFDYICRFEGERPLASFLSSTNNRISDIPNFCFLNDHNQLELTPMCEPLEQDDLPAPNFDDLPLESYLSPHITLPLLASRGCYWGRCAFCYHGMIYGKRCRARKPDSILSDIISLTRSYGAVHFAFNDEALPPKTIRGLAKVIPRNSYFFTGLYRSESSLQAEDFVGLAQIGFCSLYVGLESACNRILSKMDKNSTKEALYSNLKHSANSGIWNHTFCFFGFPSETITEADETMEYLFSNSDIIHSEGTGTFSLEHNAPVFKNPERFGIRCIKEKSNSILELYYDYEVEAGLNADEAQEQMKRFNALKDQYKKFSYGRWIPREHLLSLISHCGRDRLIQNVIEQDSSDKTLVIPACEFIKTLRIIDKQNKSRYFVVHVDNRIVLETNEDAVQLIERMPDSTMLCDLVDFFSCFKLLSA